MAYFRQLGVIGVLGACFLVASGCGDDEDKTSSGDAGEGGESAGTGGKSQGGSNSTAGKGGKSTAGSAGTGTAGSAGNAGTANDGGASGEGGTGATGGEPPVVGGGEGGGGTSMGGAGGDGPSGDAGAAGTAPTATFCQNPCEVDDDCAVGEDTSILCDQVTHHCIAPNAECAKNDDCVPEIAVWETCGVDAPCGEGFACIVWQGSSYCAPLPFEDDPDGAGGASGQETCFSDDLRTLPLFGQQGEQAVCVNANARCGAEGICFNGCGFLPDNLFCGFDGAVCDIVSGLCSCTATEQCPAKGYENAPEACE
jgi:hypothetical protein